MSEIEFRSDMVADLVDITNAKDHIVASAARISTGAIAKNPRFATPESEAGGELAGLINYLMKHRHGSPFEHAVFTFRIEIPLFVARELHRHRIASYNEMSGRYSKMLPEFYVPNNLRPLVNGGSSARPELVHGSGSQFELVSDALRASSLWSWVKYQELLNAGIANEVARMVLPVNIYTSMYMTVNARSLMNLLSLRIRHDENQYDTRPQLEIQMMAEQMEDHFAKLMPLTHAAWVKNGRVAP